MEQRIKDALTQAFAGADVEIEQLHGGRYTGKIVWEGFDAQDAIDRQRRMRQALEKGLGADASQVGVVFAYTPREMKAMSRA